MRKKLTALLLALTLISAHTPLSASDFSAIWFDTGQALRVQLVEYLGKADAAELTNMLDIMLGANVIDLATYTNFLAINISELLEDVPGPLRPGTLREILIYPHFNDPLTYLSSNWVGEGAALLTQLEELFGQGAAWRFATDLEFLMENGWVDDETLAQIFALDIKAALDDMLDTNQFESLDEMTMGEIRLLQQELLFRMIWGDFEGFDRTDVAETTHAIAVQYLEDFDFDIMPLLAAADINIDVLIDALYFMLTLNEEMTQWMAMDGGPFWLHGYIDDFFRSFHQSQDSHTIEFLHMFRIYGIIFGAMGDYAQDFFALEIFEDLWGLLGTAQYEAIFFTPAFAETLQAYGPELIALLDFRLYDELSIFFAAGGHDFTPGLAALDAMLGGLLSENPDDLYMYYTDGSQFPPVPMADDFIRYITYWHDYLVLEPDHLEKRFYFDVTEGTDFAVDFLLLDYVDNLRLNLFFANHADYAAIFIIEYLMQEHIFTVAPGESTTMQLITNTGATFGAIAWAMIVNPDGNQISGEFAVRATQQLLP